MEYPGLFVLVLAGQHQDLLYASEIFSPGGAELVVECALLSRGDQRFIRLAGFVRVGDPLCEQIFLKLPSGLVSGKQMGADDRPIGNGRGPQFAENPNAWQPIVHDVNGGGVDRIHLPYVQRSHGRHGDEQASDNDRNLAANGVFGEHERNLSALDVLALRS